MRIISGKHKGRRIFPPKNLPVRPTTDMSKEALFNILNNRYDFESIKVLDIFTGTGNISFEFASRGSAYIISVDEDYGCVKFIKQIAQEFQFEIIAIKQDVFKYIENCNTKFDIIFADPPYAISQELLDKIIHIIFEKELINKDGMLIIEHSQYIKLKDLPFFSFQKNYGGSYFSFFEAV